MSKLERKITPIGEAKWAHVHELKAPFTDKSGRVQGEPKYQMDVVFGKDDLEWTVWAKELMAEVRAHWADMDKRGVKGQHVNVPIKKEVDQNDQPTGNFFVTFKTGAKFKPGVFDKYGRPIPETVMIGNGSKVRVNYSSAKYDGFGGGINFYFNAVQVVELVEYKAQTAEGYGFAAEAAPAGETFEGAGTPQGEEEPPTQGDDSEIPF